MKDLGVCFDPNPSAKKHIEINANSLHQQLGQLIRFTREAKLLSLALKIYLTYRRPRVERDHHMEPKPPSTQRAAGRGLQSRIGASLVPAAPSLPRLLKQVQALGLILLSQRREYAAALLAVKTYQAPTLPFRSLLHSPHTQATRTHTPNLFHSSAHHSKSPVTKILAAANKHRVQYKFRVTQLERYLRNL